MLMKKVICLSVTLLMLSVFVSLFTGCSQKAQTGTILAEFDNQTVTLTELENEISELPEYKKKKYTDQEGKEEYLVLMAESRMLLKVANDKGLDEDPEILKQTQEYKDQLIVKELVKREVDDKINITDDFLKTYYEQHKDEYVEPEKVAVTEITLEDEEKAKEIMEKIKSGADFTQLAKEMSDKAESVGPGQRNEGKVTFSQDSFSSAQEFVNTAFSLEVGAMSDIIVQPIGEKTYYMIIRLDERIPPRQKEFSEVEKKIRRAVEKDQKKERMDKWLAQLKAENDFKLYPEKIPQVVEEADTTEADGEEAMTEEETAESNEKETENSE
ncbi:hypothetical protein GF312_18385 [Candidatus Poribacteria bacterium]|nr:hypothetical protein [Candidatus Poribacteria bacterium]